MAIRFQIIIGAAILVAMLMIVGQVHRGKLNLRFALSWLMLGIVLLVLDIWPGIITGLASFIGIELASNLVFFLGIMFTLILVFGLTKKISKLTDETKRLTQEVALLKEKLNHNQ